MEGLSRLVTESLVRHGLDRPLDYRRLRWSRWFRCESHHSLLQVPSKPGVFALAEEITQFVDARPAKMQPSCGERHQVEERRLNAASTATIGTAALVAEGGQPEVEDRQASPVRRMLAVTHFFEDDDMAFVLDRMLTRQNPLRSNLNSGRFFIRFVVIEDHFQRRSIYGALTQWLASSSEKASGIGSHFAASLELSANDVARAFSPATAGTSKNPGGTDEVKFEALAPHPDSSVASKLICPPPFPSGF